MRACDRTLKFILATSTGSILTNKHICFFNHGSSSEITAVSHEHKQKLVRDPEPSISLLTHPKYHSLFIQALQAQGNLESQERSTLGR